jgi:hypothetical protein
VKAIAMLLPEQKRNDKDAERHEVAIARHDVDGRGRPTFAAGRFPRRFLTIWGDRIFMAIVIVAAVIGLNGFASHVTRRAQEASSADGSGDGTVIHTEALHLWLPETLFSRTTHESLQQFLERPGQENIWYALTMRGHQVNGAFSDITIIRRPCNDPDHLPELLDILATAGGNPPSDPIVDFSTAAVHIIDEELAKREPSEVIAELLRHP